MYLLLRSIPISPFSSHDPLPPKGHRPDGTRHPKMLPSCGQRALRERHTDRTPLRWQHHGVQENCSGVCVCVCVYVYMCIYIGMYMIYNHRCSCTYLITFTGTHIQLDYLNKTSCISDINSSSDYDQYEYHWALTVQLSKFPKSRVTTPTPAKHLGLSTMNWGYHSNFWGCTPWYRLTHSYWTWPSRNDLSFPFIHGDFP